MARVSDLNVSTRLCPYEAVHFFKQLTSSSSSLLRAVRFFGSFIALGSVNRLRAGKSPNQIAVGRQPGANHRR
jgi:hypothetical protein